jgi:hypothetical protein
MKAGNINQVTLRGGKYQWVWVVEGNEEGKRG